MNWMTRITAPALLLAALVACGKPCESRDGSVDGYCDGNVANNCVTTCPDCIDEWVAVTCTGACAVGDTIGPMDKVGGTTPNISKPEAYATCSEWTDTDP